MAMASVDHLGAAAEAGGDDLLNRLRDTVQKVIVKNNRADSKTMEQILNSLLSLKSKYETLSPSEKEKFSQQMGDSFEKTISSIENKAAEQEPYEQYFIGSLLVYFGVVVTFALFGYKLYKSLMEKEHKKQEKQKNNKKSKKIKQK
ncbi:uncharacterized protein LOC129905905 isoform X1 [Episyrphus balteatus]|uniref:uncharacterized protein LOC129905905 isoform X1 n=1 Tax=Episyrphus balteatus TaxID=286459 RepID=UPI0024850CD1|nr:uncharacterized protein LOC129905905 isoform X1 [Episyrphus balteatus]